MTLWPSNGRHRRGLGRTGGSGTQEAFVFSRPLRQFVAVYVAVAVGVCLLVAPSLSSDRAYVEAMVLVSCACSVPGLVIAWRAGRRVAPGDRLVWRLWLGAFALWCVGSMRLLSMSDAMWDGLRSRSIGTAVVWLAILVVSNTLILRSRSGQRTVLIDVADIAMAMTAIVAPLALLVAVPIVEAESSWFTVSASFWFLGSLYGTAVAVVLYLRVRPDHRALARVGVAYGLVAIVATSAQVVIGVHDFTLPAGPFLATHALVVGFTVVFFLHSTSRPSTGLERFSARAQVRRRPAVTLLVLVSIPVTGALVWSRRDQDWAVGVALATAGILVVLFCVRALLAARETRILYREVERSADERAELLTDVLARAEQDQHRVATHLHRQSVQLYTALSSVATPLGRAPVGDPTGRVAERLRDDLGRQSDELARFALAVQPRDGAGPFRTPFTTPLRAQLDGLYPEGHRPDLVGDIDPDLVLDWTDEAVLVRVAAESLRLLCPRIPQATEVRIDLGIRDDAMVLAIVAVGGEDGRAEIGDVSDEELAPIRAGAELLGGRVDLDAGPHALGVTIRVPLPGAAAGHRPGPPPELRLVE